MLACTCPRGSTSAFKGLGAASDAITMWLVLHAPSSRAEQSRAVDTSRLLFRSLCRFLIRTRAPADNCVTRCAQLPCSLFANFCLRAIVLRLLCFHKTIQNRNVSCFMVYSVAHENNSVISDVKDRSDMSEVVLFGLLA